MDLIEAGKICKDSGFNWGRGSWWYALDCNPDRDLSELEANDFVSPSDLNIYGLYPDLSKGATRGVILEWAREMTGLEICVGTYIIEEKVIWIAYHYQNRKFYSLGFTNITAETEIECYAKLCQWVKENGGKNVL